MLVNAQWYEAFAQDHYAGKQETDEMHDVLPAELPVVAEVALQLLEL